MMATERGSIGGRPKGGFHLQKGMTILLDVFYRADFNGDGVLSESEFKSGFCDRNMSEENIQALYKELSAQDSVIHATDFCSFVIQHVGPFRQVLASLEDLSTAMCRATDNTADDYAKGILRSNFVTRILLREFLMQLAAVQSNVESALLRIEEIEDPFKSRRESLATSLKSAAENDAHSFIDVTNADLNVNCGPLKVISQDATQLFEKQVNKLESIIENLSHVPALLTLKQLDGINEQLKRLETLSDKFERMEMLINKVEDKVEFDLVTQETDEITDDNLLMVVEEKLDVEERHFPTFKKSLDSYVQDTRLADGCFYVSILSYHDSSTVVVYEIWESEDKWNNHVRSLIYKKFQHHNIEHLKKPEFFNTIQLPAAWWRRCS